MLSMMKWNDSYKNKIVRHISIYGPQSFFSNIYYGMNLASADRIGLIIGSVQWNACVELRKKDISLMP